MFKIIKNAFKIAKLLKDVEIINTNNQLTIKVNKDLLVYVKDSNFVLYTNGGAVIKSEMLHLNPEIKVKREDCREIYDLAEKRYKEKEMLLNLCNTERMCEHGR